MRLRFFLDLGDFSEKTVNLVTQILGFSEILIIIGSEYIPSTSIFWKKVSLLPKPQFTINLICVVRGKWTLTLTRWLSRDGECDLLVPLYVIFTQLFKWKKSSSWQTGLTQLYCWIWNNLSVNESFVQIRSLTCDWYPRFRDDFCQRIKI